MSSQNGHARVSLDDLYIMTAHMYSHRNNERPVTATLAHFVEVCAALTAMARHKRRDALDIPGALCKALGWLFPLLAKLEVVSIEELIFRKYPYVCPYCRQAPHAETECKLVKGTEATVNHSALRQAYRDNANLRPVTIDEWQTMFARIYPRQLTDVSSGRSAIGLFEELGELSEAVRVFERYPKYLAGEVADVFSYLMAISTEYSLVEQAEGRAAFSLHNEYLRRYPGLCTQCGYHVCICPPLPASTIGRMAKELDLHDAEDLFGRDYDDVGRKAGHVAERVLSHLGGYTALLREDAAFPFDRGEGNRNLVQLCLKVADVVADGNPDTAASLRSAAFRAMSNDSPAGTPMHSSEIDAVLAEIRSTPEAIAALNDGPPLGIVTEAGGRLAPKWRVLIAFSGPLDADTLALRIEARKIEEALQRSQNRDGISVKMLPAARMVDLRRAMLESDYDVLYFSGHGSYEGPLFEDDDGGTALFTVDKLRELIKVSGTVKCVVLSCCYTAGALSEPLADFTVGMDDSVDDNLATEFAVGFYDALGAARDLDRCIQEGRLAAELKGGVGSLPLLVLKSGDE
jgi:NTP pyrophosphatase (non-canonical NTP hydrolase)